MDGLKILSKILKCAIRFEVQSTANEVFHDVAKSNKIQTKSNYCKVYYLFDNKIICVFKMNRLVRLTTPNDIGAISIFKN